MAVRSANCCGTQTWALYQAKSRGRSRSVVFELAMAANQRDHYLLERDLDEAVERNQLSLVFQPKVDLVSHKVVGAGSAGPMESSDPRPE